MVRQLAEHGLLDVHQVHDCGGALLWKRHAGEAAVGTARVTLLRLFPSSRFQPLHVRFSGAARVRRPAARPGPEQGTARGNAKVEFICGVTADAEEVVARGKRQARHEWRRGGVAARGGGVARVPAVDRGRLAAGIYAVRGSRSFVAGQMLRRRGWPPRRQFRRRPLRRRGAARGVLLVLGESADVQDAREPRAPAGQGGVGFKTSLSRDDLCGARAGLRELR
mmetsp:Transcript_2229/g.6724  ORF Transcript_2229/g.6724 Transcript_2229/m.6724 type:complete len:223 (-) Transcript_2229:415-1083(-)